MNVFRALASRSFLFASLTAGLSMQVPAQASPAGIGVQVERDVTGAKVTAVSPGSPAARAGIRTGDVILSVNDAPLHSLDIDAMVASLRGPLGTSARLVVMGADGSGRTINVVRAMPISASAQAAPKTAPVAGSVTAQGASAAPVASGQGASSQGASGAPSAPSYVSWTEPKEHAFTVDVPRGWQVVGGVNWTSAIDAQQYIRLRSPDGMVQIFVGDPDLLPRQVPNAVSIQQTGVREGQQFRTGYGSTGILLRYATGSQYAEQHVRWRQLCQNPRTVWSSERPDETASLSAILAPIGRQFGAEVTVDVGEAGFLCDDAQGYVYAATVLASAPNHVIQIWGIFKVAGFVSSDPMQSMAARVITEHMIGSWTPDPAWDQAFEEKNRRVTGSYISMQNAQFAMQQNASRSASNDLARLNHPNEGVSVRPGSTRSTGVNTTLGTRDICDAIGRCKTVSNDADSYFMDHSGNVRAGRAGGAPPDNSGVWSPTYIRP